MKVLALLISLFLVNIFCEEETCTSTIDSTTTTDLSLQVWYYCYDTAEDCNNKIGCTKLVMDEKDCSDRGGVSDLNECLTDTTVYYTSCTSGDCQSGCPTGVVYGDCEETGIDGFCRVEGCGATPPGGGGDDDENSSSINSITLFW